MKNIITIPQLAGIGYLIIFISGFYANFAILENLVVVDNASLTTSNIITNNMQFRIGILTFTIMVIFDLLLTWALYLIFACVDKQLSLLASWLRLVNVTIFAVALFNLFDILNLIDNTLYLNLLQSNQLYPLIMMKLDSFNNTWLIGLIFFGIHLWLLGLLIIRSDFIPTFIGIFLMIASIGYLTDSIAHFMFTEYAIYKDIFLMIVVIPGVLGEFSLTLWFLFKGKHIKIEA